MAATLRALCRPPAAPPPPPRVPLAPRACGGGVCKRWRLRAALGGGASAKSDRPAGGCRTCPPLPSPHLPPLPPNHTPSPSARPPQPAYYLARSLSPTHSNNEPRSSPHARRSAVVIVPDSLLQVRGSRGGGGGVRARAAWHRGGGWAGSPAPAAPGAGRRAFHSYRVPVYPLWACGGRKPSAHVRVGHRARRDGDHAPCRLLATAPAPSNAQHRACLS